MNPGRFPQFQIVFAVGMNGFDVEVLPPRSCHHHLLFPSPGGRVTLDNLPFDGLQKRGQRAVVRFGLPATSPAGDKPEAMWTTRVAPWLDRVWPKDLTMVEPGSALNLAEAVVHTGGAFESAVQAVAPFLTPSDQYSTVVRDLEKSEYPERHPPSVLQLLDRIVDTECPWPDQTLRDVLKRILGIRPELATDAPYRRIDEYLRRFNL